MKRAFFPLLLCGAASLLGSAGCGSTSGPIVGSQTNWLRVCENSGDCEGLTCLCGMCTRSCSADDECAEFPGASCVAPSSDAALTACDGSIPKKSMCVQSCAQGCPTGSVCVDSVCTSHGVTAEEVGIDTTLRYQSLVGFGASLAYDESLIVNHPQKDALLKAMFEDSGFDAIRFRSAFDGDTGKPSPSLASQLIEEARTRMKTPPMLFMTSGTPPRSLKANGELYCKNADPSCTLNQVGASFDYAGFASYLRKELDAYAAAGVEPDYLSIQNNADWVPPGDVAVEACRFLPTEGMTSVTLPDKSKVDARFPGYSEALTAVSASIASLKKVPQLAGPENGVYGTPSFTADLPSADYDVLAFHLYGIDPTSIDSSALEAIGARAIATGKPVFQTEMQSKGLDTAILAHFSLSLARSSAYIHHQFATQNGDGINALIALNDQDFERLDAYYSLVHFARLTEPGFTRVEVKTSGATILATSWIAPDEKTLTLVLINPSGEARDANLTIPESFANASSSQVLRTSFDGSERLRDLGKLEHPQVRLPSHSIVTVSLKNAP